MDAIADPRPPPDEAVISVENPEKFMASVAQIIGAEVGVLSMQSRLTTDLGLGDASILYLVLLLREANPHFDIPEQCDVRDVTIHDLWHHLHNMTSEHWGEYE